MMLRFREDKIRRLESQVAGSITADQFLQEDNKALSDEIQLLQGKIDQNPEVTRFAKENIRLQEQLRRLYIHLLLSIQLSVKCSIILVIFF
jgi:kinesin family protein 15